MSDTEPQEQTSAAARAAAPYGMLVQELPLATDFDRPDSRRGAWAYPPAAKFVRLLRECHVPIGLLSNGLELRLIYAPPGESMGSLTFRVDAMVAGDGHTLIDALVMLLSAQRFFGVEDKYKLPHMLAESRKRQAEVTTKLAAQVTAALQILMTGFGEAAQRDGWDQLDAAITRGGDHLYGGLMTAVLRLIFLLYCEDRDLLPVGNPAFDDSLSLQHLFDELQADAGAHPDTMGQRFGAWGRLIALFRAVYCGLHHDNLEMPPRRGDLFDPNAYAFLEGWTLGTAPIRTAAQAQVRLPSVSDGTVYEVLKRLIFLDGQRLSYRSLDVEQIGSVYEAVMGFHVQRAQGVSVCLKGGNAWVTVEEVLAVEPEQRAAWFKDTAGMDKAAAKKLADSLGNTKSADKVLNALTAFQPRGFEPAKEGTLLLQPGKERRRTSSHYTPRSMTSPIVKRGLEPILRALGPSPSSEAILAIKVCDPAMGSGAFLVEACRHLADHLVEAWSREPENASRLTDTHEEAILQARRLVAQRCLYGVDKNPFAVRLAKLSLWAFTLARGLPFTFMDHTMRCGDTLVGLTLDQIRGFDWVAGPEPIPEFNQLVDDALREALPLREQLFDLAYRNGSVPQTEKAKILRDADDAMQHVRILGDLALWCFFSETKDKARREKRNEVLRAAQAWVVQDGWDLPPVLTAALMDLSKRVATLHWGVEFPEAFQKSGHPIDAFVGNPPFMGKNGIANLEISGYLDWLQTVNEGAHGNADYSAHFFRRAHNLLDSDGTISFIATNTIAQGDTRATGLQFLMEAGDSVYAAENNKPWEGESAVTVAVVHVAKGRSVTFCDAPLLDGAQVTQISSYLQAGLERQDAVYLESNDGAAFQGSVVLGMGFILTPDERDALIKRDRRNGERIFPYIGGEEINTSPTQAFDRYVINFGDMSLEDAKAWPDLLEIVRRKVKPERDNNKREQRRKNWWKFAERASGLYAALATVPRCLITARVTKHLCWSFQPTDRVFNEKTVVVPVATDSTFAVLQSRIYSLWAWALSSTMRNAGLNYSPSDCFVNFPFPYLDPRTDDENLSAMGKSYDAARSLHMRNAEEGLTKTYNAMTDPQSDDAEILQLRKLHEAMDRAVLDAYGWTEIVVPPYCPKTPTEVSAVATFKAEVMNRLYALNAQRAQKEASDAPTAKKPHKPAQRVDRPRARKKKEA